MTDTVSHNSTTSTATTTTTSEYIPCVRYGFPAGSKHPYQAPTLQPIDAPIPDEAETVSPVYILTDEQYERHQSFENPYAVVNASCIATALQNECEQADRVVYPVHIESDAFPEIPFETTIHHIIEFVKDELGCTASDCTFYYSGNRSIHAHIPRVTSSERAREQFKERAGQFCEEVGADFDLGIYSRKRQFRLPGVYHQKTGLPKVRIKPEWEHDRIIREAANQPERRKTYAEILSDVFAPLRQQTARSARLPAPDMTALPTELGGDKAVLSFEDVGRQIDCPLIEQEQHPTDPIDVVQWAQYNYHEFSPYAHASGNTRSVAVVTVKGGAFARKEKRGGATMIPSYFYGARGCNGRRPSRSGSRGDRHRCSRTRRSWRRTCAFDPDRRGTASRDRRVIERDSGR